MTTERAPGPAAKAGPRAISSTLFGHQSLFGRHSPPHPTPSERALRTDRGISRAITVLGLIVVAGLAPITPAFSQVKIEQDGRWRTTVGAGATKAGGNTDALSANVTAQTGMATTSRSVSLFGSALYGRSEGLVTASRFTAGSNWTWEIGGQTFAFGNGDWLRDRFANLSRRTTVSTGLGQHLVKTPLNDWDVFAGVAYSHDEYVTATEVDNLVRNDYGRPEALFGTESHHRPTETTSLHQRLVVLPALNGSGSYRLIFEGGLSVSITSRLAMTATLTLNRNSDPGVGVKKNDTLFVTGLTFKLD